MRGQVVKLDMVGYLHPQTVTVRVLVRVLHGAWMQHDMLAFAICENGDLVKSECQLACNSCIGMIRKA